MNDEKLKPCPFCGSDRRVDYHRVYDMGVEIGYRVECQQCAIYGPLADHPEGAVEKWNTRAGEANREQGE